MAGVKGLSQMVSFFDIRYSISRVSDHLTLSGCLAGHLLNHSSSSIDGHQTHCTLYETLSMANVHSLKVGIDFGTTYSGVAWVDIASQFADRWTWNAKATFVG